MMQPIKVIFNEDVVNDENHLYIPAFGTEGMFALLGFPLYDNVATKEVLYDAVRYCEERGKLPRFVFVPMKYYNKEVSEETVEEVLGHMTFADTCKNLGMEFIVMTPNFLKKRVSV